MISLTFLSETIEYIEKQTTKVETIAKALGVELPLAPEQATTESGLLQ